MYWSAIFTTASIIIFLSLCVFAKKNYRDGYFFRKENDGKTYIKYQVIGSNNIAVPTHFFKVIIIENDNNDLEMETYVMPNQVIENGTPLHVFQVIYI